MHFRDVVVVVVVAVVVVVMVGMKRGREGVSRIEGAWDRTCTVMHAYLAA